MSRKIGFVLIAIVGLILVDEAVMGACGKERCPSTPLSPYCPNRLAKQKAAACYQMCVIYTKDCRSFCDSPGNNQLGVCQDACESSFVSCATSCFAPYQACYVVEEEIEDGHCPTRLHP